MNSESIPNHCRPTSGCFGDAFEVPLEHSADGHGSGVLKVLEAHVVDAARGEQNGGPSRQDLLDALLGDVRLPKVKKVILSSLATVLLNTNGKSPEPTALTNAQKLHSKMLLRITNFIDKV